MSFQALIIDDDASFRKLLEIKLSSFLKDLSITSCETLQRTRELLGEIKNVSFDLVLVDEHLPDGSGRDLIAEGWFADTAVVSISSDEAPEIPGEAIKAGAMYFLQKRNLSEPLFKPLILGIIERNRMQQELNQARIDSTIIDTVRTLASTLRHEINNPLGAVMGAAYVLSRNESASPEQKEAANLVDTSSKRIKHVLDQICEAVEMKPVMKARHKVFHIPGDKPWNDSSKK